jgi:hypothetical protein
MNFPKIQQTQFLITPNPTQPRFHQPTPGFEAARWQNANGIDGLESSDFSRATRPPNNVQTENRQLRHHWRQASGIASIGYEVLNLHELLRRKCWRTNPGQSRIRVTWDFPNGSATLNCWDIGNFNARRKDGMVDFENEASQLDVPDGRNENGLSREMLISRFNWNSRWVWQTNGERDNQQTFSKVPALPIGINWKYRIHSHITVDEIRMKSVEQICNPETPPHQPFRFPDECWDLTRRERSKLDEFLWH